MKLDDSTLLRRRQLLIIILIFLLIFISRLPYINNCPAEVGDLWRQPDTESIARNFIKYDFNIFYPQLNYDGAPPNHVQLEFQITTFFIAILYKIFGYHFWLARLVPISFFMLSVYFLYLLAKMFFSLPQALAVIIIYSMFPINIYFSRTIMPESALLCFFNGSFYFFLKWLDDDKDFTTLTISAIFTCLAISQKPMAAFMGLAMIALCFEKFAYCIYKKWQLLAFAAIALIPNAFYFIWSGKIAEQKFVSGIAFKHILPEFLTAMTSQEALKFYITKLPEAFGIPVLVLALISIFILIKKERPILYWAVAMLLEVVLIVSVIKFPYYLIMLTPILALLAGKLLGLLWCKSYRAKAVLLLFLFVFVYNSYASTMKQFEVRHDLIKAAEIIDTYTKPQDLIIIGTFNPVLLSLSDRAGWRANLYNKDCIPQETVKEMSYFIGQGADYFLLYQNYIYGDNGGYIKYLDEHFDKKAYGKDVILYSLKAKSLKT